MRLPVFRQAGVFRFVDRHTDPVRHAAHDHRLTRRTAQPFYDGRDEQRNRWTITDS